MATFEVQIESITGIDIGASSSPKQDELTDFLKDGVIDVTNKYLESHPQEEFKFQDVTALQTSQGADLNGARIVSVVRENGTAGDFEECMYIPPGGQSKVVDKDSLHYASKFNPVYTQLEDGKISVFPAPSSSPDGYKIYFVNNSPQNAAGSSLTYAHSDIKSFPSDLVYLVVKYAAIKTLEHKMASYTIDEEDSELVQALQASVMVLRRDYDDYLMPKQAKRRPKNEG